MALPVLSYWGIFGRLGMGNVLKDLRQAIRQMRKAAGFTAVVVVAVVITAAGCGGEAGSLTPGTLMK